MVLLIAVRCRGGGVFIVRNDQMEKTNWIDNWAQRCSKIERSRYSYHSRRISIGSSEICWTDSFTHSIHLVTKLVTKLQYYLFIADRQISFKSIYSVGVSRQRPPLRETNNQQQKKWIYWLVISIVWLNIKVLLLKDQSETRYITCLFLLYFLIRYLQDCILNLTMSISYEQVLHHTVALGGTNFRKLGMQ